MLDENVEPPSFEEPYDSSYLTVEKETDKRPNKKPKANPPRPPTLSKHIPPKTPTPPGENTTPKNNWNNNLKYWHCERLGHRYMDCTEKWKRFCFKCGGKDVIRTDCPKCSEN